MMNLMISYSPGVPVMSKLSQWMDVLHLSSKWNFIHARAAAIQAIPPLASPVDKIVLGRTYDLAEWLPSAYTDILERTQSLTIEESRRMNLEDVVALAKGREDARAGTIKPRAQIEAIARSSLGLTCDVSVVTYDSLDTIPPTVEAETPATAQPERQSQEAQIRRWLVQRKDRSSEQAALRCLISYVTKHSWARSYIIEHVIKEGLELFNVQHPTGNKYSTYNGRIAYNTSKQLTEIAILLKNIPNWRDAYGLCGSLEQVLQMCLVVVKHWSGFKTLPYNLSSFELLHQPLYLALVVCTRFIDYLVSQGCVGPQIFAAFWNSLSGLFEHPSLLKHTFSTSTATFLTEAISQLNICVSRLAVCVEQDVFYHAVECAADLAKEGNMTADAAALQV
jgi:hypothetical protein